jgi:ribosomal protein S18 acetylase RimI-like enzyme
VRPPLPAPAFPDGIVLRELNVAADATARHAADTIAFPAASGYIDILAVSPGERRRGLRMTLLRTIFANCAVAGLREVALGVASDTPHAQRLYRRAGMAEHARIEVLEKHEPGCRKRERRDSNPRPLP